MASSDTRSAIVEAIAAEVRIALRDVDASHDMSHIDRVYRLALNLAEEEGLKDANSRMIVALGALLHDIADRKYSGSETATAELSQSIMTKLGVASDIQEGVQAVISSVSYSSELGGASAPSKYEKECFVVQDADRLEAIGAIGIARCLTYGGAKKRPMYNEDDLNEEHCAEVLHRTLTKEEYMKYSETTIGHFYAKLLRIHTMLKTEAGRKVAAERHKFMEVFLEQLKAEIAGAR